MTDHDQPRSERRVRLSQETFAIIGVGAVLAGLLLTITSDMRADARADRDTLNRRTEALSAEAQADRAALDRRTEALRAEARADRKAFEEKFEAGNRKFEEKFGTIQSEILRLTKGQVALTAQVAQLGKKED